MTVGIGNINVLLYILKFWRKHLCIVLASSLVVLNFKSMIKEKSEIYVNIFNAID